MRTVVERLRAGARLVSLFGSREDGGVRVRAVLDEGGAEYTLLADAVGAELASLTSITPGAAWYERELHERFGVNVSGHPDLRPLVDHQHCPPLTVEGDGVSEVAVGPVHAGIIEPGHFRFSVMGDAVLHLDLRHFYTHKGTEALFEGQAAGDAVRLAESVSGDNCFAQAVAYCQAVEAAAGVAAPARAQALRLVGMELERLLAHAGDFGGLCNDVAYPVANMMAARLKESLLRVSGEAMGTRFWRGVSVVGGVGRNLDAEGARRLSREVGEAAAALAQLAEAALDTPSVLRRFQGSGILSAADARALGVVGPAARASGLGLDVRRDHPSGWYREKTVLPRTGSEGDVLARARVRIAEAADAAALIQSVLGALPAGGTRVAAGLASGEGWSAVESPRGELLYWVRLEAGRIRRCHIKSPSFQNWPALPRSMPGNIIADFPLINKSFSLSYSGCDR